MEIAIFLFGALVGALALHLLFRRAERPAPEDVLSPPPDPIDVGPIVPSSAEGLAHTPRPNPLPVLGADPRRWRPPYVSGQPLFEWARSVSRGIVREVTQEGVDAGTAAELAERLGPGVAQALLPDTEPATRTGPTPCPSSGQGLTGVTAPEAIALAAWLRDRLTQGELEELLQDVTLCEEWVTNGAGTPCALQGDDRVCIAYGAHPLGCRPTLATVLATRLRGESGTPDGARAFADTHVETVARGVLQGVREGLERAELDPRTYELHSALRRALSRPDAAEAWARGDDVFAQCREISEARSGVVPRVVEPLSSRD